MLQYKLSHRHVASCCAALRCVASPRVASRCITLCYFPLSPTRGSKTRASDHYPCVFVSHPMRPSPRKARPPPLRAGAFCTSICSSVRRSVRPSVCPSVCLSVCSSVCQRTRGLVAAEAPHSWLWETTSLLTGVALCPSVCPSVRMSACPSVRLSVCPSVRLSVCLSARLPVSPSVYVISRAGFFYAGSGRFRTYRG